MAVEVVRGFVLRAVPVGDADRILDILTRERGLIKPSARGARRTRSRMLASTQEFALSDFTLFSNRSRLIVNEVELVESFIGLQSDLTKLVSPHIFQNCSLTVCAMSLNSRPCIHFGHIL